MAIKKLEIDTSTLDFEYNELTKELKELDELFNSSKKLLDSNSGVRSNALFISSQTSNLISIKEKKLNIYKELISIKEKKMDIQIKEFTANKNNNDDSNNNGEALKQLFGMLMNENKDKIIESSIQTLPESTNQKELDKDIDRLLDERLNSIVEINNNEKQKNTTINVKSLIDLLEKENKKIVVDEERNIYIIDNDYNLIEDNEYKDIIGNILITKYDEKDPENPIAIDAEGNKFEVIVFSEN